MASRVFEEFDLRKQGGISASTRITTSNFILQKAVAVDLISSFDRGSGTYSLSHIKMPTTHNF
jgi:hypothetical protein